MRAVLLAASLCSAGCAARVPPPLTPPRVVDARDPRVRTLQQDLATRFDQAALRRGVVAVVVESADRGDTLFRYHDDTLVMPASNMKLVTLAVAAERLGWDYTFTTTIAAGTPIVDGVLDGDLAVTGTGDPTIGAEDGGAAALMDQWADSLWQQGLRHVAGRLIGDDRAFSGAPLGAGWAWDDLAWGYAAPVGALQANVDAAEVRSTAGAREGDPASVTLAPPESGLVLDAAVNTGPAGAAAVINVVRRPGTTTLHVSGVVPAGSDPIVRAVAVDHPTDYFLRLLSSALLRRGITVGDGITSVLALPPYEWPGPEAAVLVQHQSVPLREMARTLMKASQNQYAETLLRSLARSEGAAATVEGGQGIVRRVLAGWGVSADTVVVADGSGLSRYNFVTAGALAAVLRHMYRDERHRVAWLDALAVGGVDGTLDRRFKGTAAEGKLRAKTGTLSNVRALSGYVPAANGERLLFVMILNNVTAGRQELDGITDAAVLRLMQFSR